MLIDDPELRRLRALVGEAHHGVVADHDRAESSEGRYGYGSPESDAAWVEYRLSVERWSAAGAEHRRHLRS